MEPPDSGQPKQPGQQRDALAGSQWEGMQAIWLHLGTSSHDTGSCRLSPSCCPDLQYPRGDPSLQVMLPSSQRGRTANNWSVRCYTNKNTFLKGRSEHSSTFSSFLPLITHKPLSKKDYWLQQKRYNLTSHQNVKFKFYGWDMMWLILATFLNLVKAIIALNTLLEKLLQMFRKGRSRGICNYFLNGNSRS